MKRVLLTGATGFIGRQCLPLLLEKGFEVCAVSSSPDKFSDDSRIQWIATDLLDSESVTRLFQGGGFSYLLHFAWYVVPGRLYTSLENFKWVESGLQMLRAFADNGGKRAVFAGSCAEYDWRYGLCSEYLTPLQPASTYGVCKNALREMYEEFSDKVKLSAAWGRIFFVYGPFEHRSRLVSSVISSLLQKKPALCSHSQQIRDYLYVEDVAAAFVSLLDCDIQGAVNICSGRPLRLRELIEKIAVELNEQGLLRIGALQSSVNEPPLVVGNIQRLKSEVCFNPKYTLDDGIKKTIGWWREVLKVS